MKLVISQPRFLPSNSYMERFLFSDHFVFFDTDIFTPRDWENRNRIHNGTNYIWLTVPIRKENKKLQIKDVVVDDSVNWRRKIISSIYLNYKRSPFFDEVYPVIESGIKAKSNFLMDINNSIIFDVLNFSGVSFSFSYSSDSFSENKGDRFLLDVCKEFGADTYISGINGRSYIDIESWNCDMVDVVFQEYKDRVYNQHNNRNKFISQLSCIDTLFNIGFGRYKEYLEGSSTFS